MNFDVAEKAIKNSLYALVAIINEQVVGIGRRLFAAEGSLPFYEKYGFKDYSPSMTGIFRITPF